MAGRLVVVSADCHASPHPSLLRDYVDPAFRDHFDVWLADTAGRARRKAQHTGEAIYGDEARGDFEALDAVKTGGLDGAWNPARRLEELEADGVAAEIVYPGGGGETITPFDVGLMTYQYEQDPAIWQAGCRAYNRWLADFCAAAPGRRAGVALVTFDDLDATVREIESLRDRGVFGGVLLPSGTGHNPLYNDPYYERLWAVCEAEALPVHTHTGWTPNYGDFPGSLGIFLTEISWFAHRTLWLLVWSGVFERHANLRLVMTEQGSTWIPDTLQQLDRFYDMAMFRHLRRQLPTRPSQYFARQCFVGASFLGTPEAACRHEIGVSKMMWGSDYPHIEGTWPHTQAKLRESFAGVALNEIAAIVGQNAIGVFGFDADLLAATANRIGPESDAFTSAVPT
ncbi:MAG: amidohydrolase family protein [Acidimicrobiales bacterium]